MRGSLTYIPLFIIIEFSNVKNTIIDIDRTLSSDMFCDGGENLALQYEQGSLREVRLAKVVGHRLPKFGVAVVDAICIVALGIRLGVVVRCLPPLCCSLLSCLIFPFPLDV